VKGGNVPQGTARLQPSTPLGFTGTTSMDDRTRQFSMSNFQKVCLFGINGSITRLIPRFRNGNGAPANDGHEFHVIEHA
jgi:hypothetical protein